MRRHATIEYEYRCCLRDDGSRSPFVCGRRCHRRPANASAAAPRGRILTAADKAADVPGGAPTGYKLPYRIPNRQGLLRGQSRRIENHRRLYAAETDQAPGTGTGAAMSEDGERRSVLPRLAVAAVVVAGIAVLFVVLWSAGAYNTRGLIFVGSPEVYTRERLVNDRYDQDFWLHSQLDRLDKTTALLTSLVRDTVSVGATVGIGGTDPPTGGAAEGRRRSGARRARRRNAADAVRSGIPDQGGRAGCHPPAHPRESPRRPPRPDRQFRLRAQVRHQRHRRGQHLRLRLRQGVGQGKATLLRGASERDRQRHGQGRGG